MSVQPRLAIAFWLTSVTLMPTISATVSGIVFTTVGGARLGDIESLDEAALRYAGAFERLVDRFYDRVQHDPVLGPIFNPAVHDWADLIVSDDASEGVRRR